MLSNINNYNPHHSFSTILPQKEDKSTLAINTLQLKGSSADLCKQPLNQLDLIELLYRQELLPHMKSVEQPFIKVSRKKCDFLENSILVNQAGEVFEQYHWNDKKGCMNTDVEKKGLLGMGSSKRVWELKPLNPNLTSIQMVRARFHLTLSRSREVQEQVNNVEKLKNKVDCRFLLIPNSITYTASCGFLTIVQMMPKALGGDLSYASKREECLSYLGRLRAMRDLGLALTGMHIRNWAHLDVKPQNVILMSQDPNNPILKLTDFDFTRKFKENDASSFCCGTARYMDPKTLNNEACGLEDAKIHDQFSFGATCYELLTGDNVRKSVDEKVLKEWVKEADLNTNPKFLLLDESIQDIIRKCCLGPSEIRPYKLPEFAAMLEEVINLEEERLQTT